MATATKIMAEIQAKVKALSIAIKRAKTERQQLKLIREFKYDVRRVIAIAPSRNTILTCQQWMVLDVLIKLRADQRFGCALHQALKFKSHIVYYSLRRLEEKAYISSSDDLPQRRRLFSITDEGRAAHKLLAKLGVPTRKTK